MESNIERIFSPIRHLPLGFQIAFLSLLFTFGFCLVFLGFKRAGAALDLALDGVKYQLGVVGFWMILCFVGAGLSAGVVTYWLGERIRAERHVEFVKMIA